MFGLFGNKPKKSVDNELIPELKSRVVQIQESAGISYLAITLPMLGLGSSFSTEGKGAQGLAQEINRLSRQLEEEQKALGSLGSAIMDVGVPELPRQHTDIAIDRLADFADSFSKRGYSLDEIGRAMSAVSHQLAKAIDKDNLLIVGMLRRVISRLREKYHAEQFRQTASGETCTEESIKILLRAESSGFMITISNDRTFVLSKGSTVNYLRSNWDIKRFESSLNSQTDEEDHSRDPIDRLLEQGHKAIREQKLDSAISAFSAALRISPNDRDIYFHRGIAWSNSYYNRGKKLGDLDRAVEDYTRAIEIDPEFAEGYFQRAGLLSAKDENAASIADYGMAIERGHKASSSYYCRGLLWQRTGEAGKANALADFAGAIQTGDREDQFMALMARADAHHEFGDLELALDDLNAAEAYHPKGPPGLYGTRAAILMKLERYTEAVADFGKGIAAASPLASSEFIANMYEQRGRCRAQLGESSLARQDLDAAAQLRRGTR
ncbi:MAG: tetratricopeptide repeat protein [Bradyrhizobium sp.]|uniref:tetratricopeptide repeat protein n=1 Tax=Bradyrhizobium sp. TaxID=376 RepID=UPI001A275B89|nr:tetratricopeptide repeat protein [Bradyrhizobium sp.]MBJ7402180.1 tetratricopeptide repeat protein [Bradyrhizobium sp.]